MENPRLATASVLSLGNEDQNSQSGDFREIGDLERFPQNEADRLIRPTPPLPLSYIQLLPLIKQPPFSISGAK